MVAAAAVCKDRPRAGMPTCSNPAGFRIFPPPAGGDEEMKGKGLGTFHEGGKIEIGRFCIMEDSESIIERAIKNEEEAYDFYMDLSRRIEDREAKDTLLYLAQEEKGHREYLLKYRQEGFAGPSRPVIDYKVAENLVKPDIQKNIESKDVYLIAANRELNAHNFYKGLAALHAAGEIQDMLLRMANEEMKHKEKMEYLYANTAFPQTAGG